MKLIWLSRHSVIPVTLVLSQVSMLIITGSIIRCMRRLEETMRQMCQAAKAIGNPELEEKFLKGQLSIALLDLDTTVLNIWYFELLHYYVQLLHIHYPVMHFWRVKEQYGAKQQGESNDDGLLPAFAANDQKLWQGSVCCAYLPDSFSILPEENDVAKQILWLHLKFMFVKM